MVVGKTAALSGLGDDAVAQQLTSPHEAVRMDFQWGMAAAWPELEGGGLAGDRRLDVRTTSGAGGR